MSIAAVVFFAQDLVKTTEFLRAFQIFKTVGFLDFCISVFSFIFSNILGKKSYGKSAGVKTTEFFRAFQFSAWVTWSEHPKSRHLDFKSSIFISG